MAVLKGGLSGIVAAVGRARTEDAVPRNIAASPLAGEGARAPGTAA